MSTIGTVDSLWRYPIKSMRGEQLSEAFVGFSGVYGDRLFAFRSSASPKAFPYLTAREQSKLLHYRPRFRFPDKAARPINPAEAEGISLENFFKMLPKDSVDSVNLDFSKGPPVFALIKVPELPGKDLSKIRFETTFKTKEGQVIEKHWTGGEDRKAGKSMAVFCVPPSIVDGETKVVSIDK